MTREKYPFDLRLITRFDYGPTKKDKLGRHGWWVRRQKRSIPIKSKFFNDAKYGGKDKALEAAKKYRDQIEKKVPVLTKEQRYRIKTSRNKSGVIGVHKTNSTSKDKRGRAYTYTFWVANWLDPVSGKRSHRSFAISKYGEAEALRLALKARDEAMARILGVKHEAISWSDNSVSSLIIFVETSTNSYEKGRILEELIYRLFNTHPGFSVTDRRVQTETEEIDLLLLNSSTDPRFSRESAILLVECKNWSGKCGKNEFVIFKEKVENRSSRCSLGFLISWNGFAETVTKEMLRGSREQTLVIPIEGDTIKKAINQGNFEKMLIQAWHDAVTI